MIRKSGYRFSEKIMLKRIERDDDSKKSHPALAQSFGIARSDLYAVTQPAKAKTRVLRTYSSRGPLRTLGSAGLGPLPPAGLPRARRPMRTLHRGRAARGAALRDTNQIPGILHRPQLIAPSAVPASSHQLGHRCEIDKLRVRFQFLVTQGLVPDPAGPLPGEAAERHGCQIESPIQNAIVRVDTSVVILCLKIIAHMRGLTIFPQYRVIVRGPGGGERYNRPLSSEDTIADEPIGLRCRLTQCELLHQRCEYEAHRVEEGAGLTPVDELGRARYDAVRKLFCHHVQGSEWLERLAIAVTKGHLLAIPEGIVEVLAVVDRGD